MLTGLLLAALLNAAPASTLADSSGSRHVRFERVSDDWWNLHGDLDTMTRDQLNFELHRLDETRPSLFAPVLYMAIGGVAAAGGVFSTYTGVLLAFVRGGGFLHTGVLTSAMVAGGITLLVVGGVLLISAAIMLGMGGTKLGRRLAERHATGRQMEEVEQRLEQLELHGPPQQPGAFDRSPQAFVVPSQPVVVARF